jgi:hypothetical protein
MNSTPRSGSPTGSSKARDAGNDELKRYYEAQRRAKLLRVLGKENSDAGL